MTVITPPLFLNVDSTYGADDLGLPYRDFISEGVASSTALAVSERGAGANMSVDVAAGVAWILGDDATAQPCYRVYNDGTVNLTVTTADATNPRIDRVVAEVLDSTFSGASNLWRLRVIAGTPAGSPSAPALPSNAISLATISVPAGDTTIGSAQITDTRPRAQLGASLGPTVVTSLPSNPYDGQEIEYVADSTNGVVWRFRYRAASGSSYKWEFVGGRPLYSEVTTTESTTSGSYAALATAGPSVALPFAGDYDVTIGCRSFCTTASVDTYMSYDIGGTGAVDADSLVHHTGPGGTFSSASSGFVRTRRKTGLTAVTLTSKYKTSGGTAYWLNRYMSVAPVRIG